MCNVTLHLHLLTLSKLILSSGSVWKLKGLHAVRGYVEEPV